MTKRDRLMLLAVLAVVLLGGFWFLVLTPQRKAASEAQAGVASARLALDAAQQKLTAGKAAQQAFRRDRTTIVKLGRVVPESDDIPTLLTQLEALSKKEGVEFVSWAVDSAGQSSGPATGTTGTDATATTPSGTRSTDTVAPLYSPGSVEVAGGLGRTPIALTLKGTYFQLESFLQAVQRFAVLSAKQERTKGRLIIVDGFGYQPEQTIDQAVNDGETAKVKKPARSPKLTATLSASVYFAPPLETPSAGTADAAATATPAAGTATPPAPSTSTGAATAGVLR